MYRKLTRRRPLLLLLAVAASAALYFFFSGSDDRMPPMAVQSVGAARARIDTVDVYFHALGTVTPPQTVTVRSRVDGQLMALHFTEGAFAEQGDLLAEIDPRPFEVQRQQALGTLARDEALLKDARLDLARYRKLIKEQSISAQQLQAQEALVGQYEGAVATDKAAVADAELQLTYSRVTAPIAGRVGLRKVDVGNMIRSSDSEGLVVLTQMDPMQVIFTLVESQIPDVLEAAAGDASLVVEAWGRENRRMLAQGRLLTIDNQIDTATGTVKAKAEFDNKGGTLFPNQFVNARLRVRSLENQLVVPSSAVQRGNKGWFVYVAKTRAEAESAGLNTSAASAGRSGGGQGKGGGKGPGAPGAEALMSWSVPVEIGHAGDSVTVIESGLAEGDIVITDGVDRLRDGLPVRISQ